MSGFATDVEILRRRMASGWKALGSPVPLLWDNARADKNPPASFVRFSVRPGTEEQRSLGNDRVRVRRDGRVWLQIAVPIGGPDSEAWALADLAKSLFARWHSDDRTLRCWEVKSTVVPDDKHYFVAISIRYSSDRSEVRTPV